jgi:hypothetical protein
MRIDMSFGISPSFIDRAEECGRRMLATGDRVAFIDAIGFYVLLDEHTPGYTVWGDITVDGHKLFIAWDSAKD